MSAGRRRALVGLGIGLALADSSVVTLALPDILRQFDVEIPTVAWVLTSYNLWLALAAVPAAYAARRRPVPAFTAGTLVFAAASLACALAPSFGVLVGARCDPRRGARTRDRRDPHRDARLGVDLRRPGTPRPADPGGGARAARPTGCRARRTAERLREPRAAAALGRADCGPVPPRVAPRRRLAAGSRRRRRRRDGDAGGRDRDRKPCVPHRQHRDARGGGGRPRDGRPCRARRAPRLGVVVDGAAADPRRRRSRAGALRTHRARPLRPVAAGRARRLDDRGPARGRRPRPAAADAGVHHGPRPQRGTSASGGGGGRPGQL